MKYAVISYENKRLRLDGTDKQNIGDWIQTIAAEYLLKEFGIENNLRLSRNTLKSYSKNDEICLLFNGWNSFSEFSFYEGSPLPVADNITPVFFSFNLTSNYIPKAAKEQLIEYGPVGCRDEGTYYRLKKNGVDAYISGCLTALLPRRVENNEKQTKNILIDVPSEFFEYIPEKIMNNSEIRTNMLDISRTEGLKHMTDEESRFTYDKARELLDYLSNNAKLVITSRLHVASPCVAMGIPVIFVKKNIDKRFSWLDKYIPLYSREDWDKVNWNPEIVEYEEEKENIKKILRKRLLDSELGIEDKEWIHSYYSDRKRANYDEIVKNGFERYIKNLIETKKVVVCGVVVDTLWVTNYLTDNIEGLSIEEVYDVKSERDMLYEGVSVKHFDDIKIDKEYIYIITSRKMKAAMEKYINDNSIKYIITDVENSDWQSNLI